MSVCYHLVGITILLCIVPCGAAWWWSVDPNANLCSSVDTVAVNSSFYRVYGVCNGRVRGRNGMHSDSDWNVEWNDHGSPSLYTGETLVSAPCTVFDGKIFVITTRGRLFERYLMNNVWIWVYHGYAMGNQAIDPAKGCHVIHNQYSDRVFVVGTNNQLYERYWKWDVLQWVWRSHGNPPGTTVGSIGTCNEQSCPSDVYVVGADGELYKRSIGKSNVGNPSWKTIGSPTCGRVQTVSYSRDGLLITTYDNNICEYFGSSSWLCYCKPKFSIDLSASISKVAKVSRCPGLKNGRYIFIYSWDPIDNVRGRLFSLYITKKNVPTWKDHGGSGLLIGVPHFFKRGKCPGAFTVQGSGSLAQIFYRKIVK